MANFDAYGIPLTLEEARREIVIIYEELVSAYYGNKEAMEGWSDLHWPEKTVGISIDNANWKGDDPKFPYIGLAMIVRGRVFLMSFEDDRSNPVFESKESYVEALRKVIEEVPTPGSAWQVSPCLMEHLKRRLAEIEARGEPPEVEEPQKTKFYEGYLITEGFF